MAARYNPSFVRNPRSIGAKRHIVAAHFNDAQPLALLLRENVAENAAFFALKILAPSAQLIQDAARHKNRRRQLRRGVIEFLSRRLAMILENADVLKPAVALQILNSLRGQPQKLLDFDVLGIPDVAIVPWIFQQNLVRSDRSHAVIKPSPRRAASPSM